jgi:hypothetical protein
MNYFDYTETFHDIIDKYSKTTSKKSYYEKKFNELANKFKEEINALDDITKRKEKSMIRNIFKIINDFNIITQRNNLIHTETTDIESIQVEPTKKLYNSTNNELLSEAKMIQKNTTSELKTSLQLLVQTNEIGDAAIEILNKDNQTLSRINENIENIDTDLSLSKKYIARFMKSIYTDKIIIAFVCLIFLIIIGIVLYKLNII